MKKEKPSKHAAIPTKIESNKGDSKGIVLTHMDGNTSRDLTKEETKKLAAKLSNSKKENIEVDEAYVDWLRSLDRETFKAWLQNNIHEQTLTSGKIISSTFGRSFGTQTQKEKAETRYQIAKDIFVFLKSKGEKLPIKRSQIKNVFDPIWKIRTTIKIPTDKTLYSFQDRFMIEMQ